MSKYNNMTLTDAGRLLLARVHTGECDMEITHAVIGNGEYGGTERIAGQEALKNPVQSFGISSYEREEDQILIRFIASNFDMPSGTGFTEDCYIREIGVYAKEKNTGNEILYALATAQVPSFMPAYEADSPVTITFSIYVYVGDNADISIKVDPTAYVITEVFNREKERLDASIAKALVDANQFTREKLAALVDGAPETLDTLKEVADALAENETVVEALDSAIGTKLDKTGEASEVTVTFEQATRREAITSGEKLSVLFGKIKKWLTDLKSVAFTGSYNDLTDKPAIPAAVRIKGNEESAYRTGDVNLTPKDIGANPKYRTTFSSGENGSAAGWYRVCSFVPKTVMQFTLNISRIFYNNPEEALSLKVSVFTGQGTNRVDFEQLNATWRDHIIKKVRVTYANEGEPNHLELYYGGDYKNRVTCDIYNVTNGATAEEGDLLEMLTPAKSSYSGTAWEYTVTKEGSIAKNAVGVLDTHNGNEIKISYAAPNISNFDWVGAWDGYELKTGSPANVVKNGNGLGKNSGSDLPISNVNIRWFTIVVTGGGTGVDYNFGGTMASVVCCVNGDVNATDLHIKSWENISRTKVHFNFSKEWTDSIRITGLLMYSP